MGCMCLFELWFSQGIAAAAARYMPSSGIAGSYHFRFYDMNLKTEVFKEPL